MNHFEIAPGRQKPAEERQIARLVLYVFLLTFIVSRMLVFLIMARAVPDLFLHLGGTHIHHLNYGIFLLSGVGGWLVFRPLAERRTAAIVYAVGLALTFDEFGMCYTWAGATGNAPVGTQSWLWRASSACSLSGLPLPGIGRGTGYLRRWCLRQLRSSFSLSQHRFATHPTLASRNSSGWKISGHGEPGTALDGLST
jgi:hypothetical protein